MTDFTIILRSMRVRLFSTITTVITVGVALALLLVLVTMRDSGEKAFDRGSGDMHLLVSADASPLVAVLNSIYYAGAPRRPITWDRFEQLRDQFPWAYAVPTQVGDNFLGSPVVGTSADMFARFRPNPGEPWEFAEGGPFKKEFEVVVGAAAARAHHLQIGDTLYFGHGMRTAGIRIPKGQPLPAHEEHAHHDEAEEAAEGPGHVHTEFGYTVVGILRPTGGSHDRALFTDLNSAWIIHAQDRRERENPDAPAATGADLLPTDKKITGVYLRLVTREGSDAPANLPQVFDTLRRDTSITVAQPKQEIDKLFKIVSNVNQIMVAVGLAVMVSSGIAIMLALYNSMEQRRRQIAILRVLGASRRRVFGLVLTESALIGIFGASAGALAGIGGAVVASGVLRERLGLAVSPWPDPTSALVLVAGTIALSCLAGIVPAMVAYRTGVAKNLAIGRDCARQMWRLRRRSSGRYDRAPSFVWSRP